MKTFSKKVLKKPAAENSFTAGKGVDIQTAEKGNVCYSWKAREKKWRECDTLQERARSPVQQVSFSGCMVSAQRVEVPNKTKDFRENQGRQHI